MVPALGLTLRPPVIMPTISEVEASAADLKRISFSLRQYLGFMENLGGIAFSTA